MNEKIKNILNAAIRAPSGDNCQPWRFLVKDNIIEIHNLPERDLSLYNYLQRASYISHGALLENMRLAANVEGFDLNIKLFPDTGNHNLVALAELVAGGVGCDPLSDFIYDRCTNRMAFSQNEIIDEEIATLISCAGGFDNTRVVLTRGETEKNLFASLVAKNDWLVFANKKLHNFLFKHIRWSSEDASNSLDGLDIESLGLSNGEQRTFPLLRSWLLVNFLNHFGLARMINRKAERLCRNSAHIGAIIVAGSSSEDYVLGGQLMQRVWLQATKLQLQFQPYAGLSLLMQRVREGNHVNLSVKSENVLRNAMLKLIDRGFVSEGEVILMFFRVGRSVAPAKKSARYALEDVVDFDNQ